MTRHGGRPRISFYDTRVDAANLKSLSFYLNGFMENQDRLGYTFEIERSVPTGLGLTRAQSQTLAVGYFRYALNGEELYFCIDRHDNNFAVIAPDLAALSAVDIVFKANYHAEHIRSMIADEPTRDKFVPVSHSFPIAIAHAGRYAFAALPARIDWSIERARNRVRYLTWPKEPELDRLCNERHFPSDLDVFFVMAYYAQDRHSQASRFRAEIMLGLKSLRGRKIETGLVTDAALPARWKDLRFPRLAASDYFSRLRRARVAIYVRGPHDGISSKFGQYLALGKPIIGQPLENCREDLMSLPYFDEQFVHETPESIVAGVDDLLNDTERLEVWGKSNAAVFDRTLKPRAAVDHMLGEIRRRLDARAPHLQPVSNRRGCNAKQTSPGSSGTPPT
jgi:hypothetical protein